MPVSESVTPRFLYWETIGMSESRRMRGVLVRLSALYSMIPDLSSFTAMPFAEAQLWMESMEFYSVAREEPNTA